MPQDEHRALVRLQAPEAALELVVGREVDGRVGDRGAQRPRDVDLGDLDVVMPALAPELLVARPDDEPPQPGVEPAGVRRADRPRRGQDVRLLGRVRARSGSRRMRPATE